MRLYCLPHTQERGLRRESSISSTFVHFGPRVWESSCEVFLLPPLGGGPGRFLALTPPQLSWDPRG